MSERSWARACSHLQSEPFLLRMETTGTNSQNWRRESLLRFALKRQTAHPPAHFPPSPDCRQTVWWAERSQFELPGDFPGQIEKVQASTPSKTKKGPSLCARSLVGKLLLLGPQLLLRRRGSIPFTETFPAAPIASLNEARSQVVATAVAAATRRSSFASSHASYVACSSGTRSRGLSLAELGALTSTS